MNFRNGPTFLSLITCLAFLSAQAQAAAGDATNDSTKLLVSFAKCNSDFFRELNQKPGLLGAQMKFSTDGYWSTPTVSNPEGDKDRVQNFIEPIDSDGIRLLLWRNEIDVIAGLTTMFWGFDVEGTPDKVANVLNKMLPSDQRVTKVDDVWVRGDIRRTGDPADFWRKEALSSGIPKQGTLERVLIIEPHQNPNQTKVNCSIQGEMDASFIKKLRPDLGILKTAK